MRAVHQADKCLLCAFLAYCNNLIARLQHRVAARNDEDGTTDDNEDGGDAQNGSEASPTPAPTAEPTPNANNPIIVNGGNRENTSSGSTSDGMTAETIRDTEDPERR